MLMVVTKATSTGSLPDHSYQPASHVTLREVNVKTLDRRRSTSAPMGGPYREGGDSRTIDIAR
jgi:hypothetical protein